ncbi:MAG TPA: hypothetical protein VMT54_12060 [Candidatus Cybelea sp.]|nr:hypothetical protein [Candidatus Cybelea sp.]
MRKFVLPWLVAVALGSGAAAPATANTIGYSWSGIVDHVVAGSPAGVTVGQHITISLSLSDAVPDMNPSPSHGDYETMADIPPVLVLGVDIGGVTDIGAFQFGTVLHDEGGVDEFDVETGDQMIGSRFDIHFATTHPGVLSSDAIPLSINPADFETATFSVNEPGPLQEFLPVFNGRILAVSTLPVPNSLAMFSLALGCLWVVAAWRSARTRKPA